MEMSFVDCSCRVCIHKQSYLHKKYKPRGNVKSPTAHDTLRRMHFGQNQATPAALGQLEFVHTYVDVSTHVCVCS